MKATINGITIEGTAEEILEYQRLHGQMIQSKPFKPGISGLSKALEMIDKTYAMYNVSASANSKGKCPNEGHVCFCTGACK